MSDQSNLPLFRKYGKIKEVVIKKNVNADKFGNRHDYYYISFIEIVEKEVEQRKLLFKKEKFIVPEEVKRIVPFSFKSLETAKDFAQYLPGMSIVGFRFSRDFTEVNFSVSYETYKIQVDGIDAVIYIKFVKNTENQRTYLGSKTGEITRYYENDLDVHSEPSGEFFQYNEIVVDYYFTDITYDDRHKCIIPNVEYKTISDIKEFENENTHKFVLIEQ